MTSKNLKRNWLTIITSFLCVISFGILLNITLTYAESNSTFANAFQAQTTTATPLLSQSSLVPPTSTMTLVPFKSWALESQLIINNSRGAWLRQEPSSEGLVVVVLRDRNEVRVREFPPIYDGTQYWWSLMTSDGLYSGFIEEASLGPIGKANWRVGQQLIITNPNSVWVRLSPDSNSDIVIVVGDGNLVTVLGSPQTDGIQWWWQVRANVRGNAYVGWVEQNSLRLWNPPPPPLNPSVTVDDLVTTEAPIITTAPPPIATTEVPVVTTEPPPPTIRPRATNNRPTPTVIP